MRNIDRPPSAGAPFRKPNKKPKEIVYPESDGKPLAETDTHVDAILACKDLLRRHFSSRADAYVAANNFIFYTEGEPKDRFSPDVYVVFGVEKKSRNSYFLWEEKQPPAIVIEFTSRKTKKNDLTKKKELCERLGVKEYFLCDPQSKSLKPPLQGFRLVDGRYQAIPALRDGAVLSHELDALIRLENEVLVLYGGETGGRILSAGEEARAQALRAQQEALRANAAEIENARLREELESLKSQRTSTQRE